MKIKKLWVGIVLLIFLTPLGLLAGGSAWGEWSIDELSSMIGYTPSGLEKDSNIWSAALEGYNIPGWGESLLSSGFGYLLSAAIGIGVIITVAWIAGRFLTSEEERLENEFT